MRIDLLKVNRMSFSTKGQGELECGWIKYVNSASPYFMCLSEPLSQANQVRKA